MDKRDLQDPRRSVRRNSRALRQVRKAGRNADPARQLYANKHVQGLRHRVGLFRSHGWRDERARWLYFSDDSCPERRHQEVGAVPNLALHKVINILI